MTNINLPREGNFRTFRLLPKDRELLQNLGRGRADIEDRHAALLELVQIVREMEVPPKEERQPLRIRIPTGLVNEIGQRADQSGHTAQDILLMAAQILEDLQSDALNQSLSRIIGNIEKVLQDKGLNNRKLVKIIPALSRKPDPITFQTILNALNNGKKLKLSYQSRYSDQATERLVSPQRFTSYKNAWYLDAYCHLRDDIRLFALENISSCELDIENSKNLAENSLREHYAQSYGIFAGEATHSAQIVFDTELAPWSKNIHWHSEQSHKQIDDTHILITLPYNHSAELIADILHFGPAAKVLAPQKLKQQVKDTLSATSKLYYSE